MANVRKNNVLVVDSTAAFAGQLKVKAIKYIGASSSSIVIKADDSGGPTIWEESAATNVCNEVCIDAKGGLHITVTGTAKVYLYLD